MAVRNTEARTRLACAILAISTILSSWLLMQVVHEIGHVLGAILTGAEFQRVVLAPWELSRTDLLQNPYPLIVSWAGPIFGAMFPAVVWLVAARRGWFIAFWLRFFAGFCLIANGAYIGIGEFSHDGDAGDLLREGSPGWTLWLFGAVTVPLGFAVWHKLGRHFGLGHDGRMIHWRMATASSLVLIVIIVAETVSVQLI